MKMMSVDPLLGRCLSMCPEKERRMREREGLLHRYEIDESNDMIKPKADPVKTIKCFSRSAAGQIMTDLDSLRPPHVLLSTIQYLFTKIITQTDLDWVLIYDFVFDRLRSIRQDAVIQRIDIPANILLLEPIVRFHIYAAQRLCERKISDFDAKINNNHLLECIKQLLVLYDQRDCKDTTDSTNVYQDFEKLTLNDNRSEMEALYILLHIGDQEALRRAVALSPDLKNTPAIKLAIKISLAWYLKNYVRVCRLIQHLPPLLACAFFCNLQSFRRCVLQIMSSGYNSKVLTFPGLKLQQLLFYKDINLVQADCNLFGLIFTNENVLFQKSQFKKEVLLANPEMYYTSTELHNFIPKILLECMSM